MKSKFNVVWCEALAIVIRLQGNINIQVRNSKYPQKFQDKLFIAEGQTESTSCISQFWKAIRNVT